MSDLEFGLRTTVVGMGIVVGLLGVMWALLALALRLDRRGTAEPDGEVVDAEGTAATPAPGVRIAGAGAIDPILVAAITVAVLRHAEARRLQAAPAMRSYWPGSLLFASRWVAAGRMRQGQSWRRRSR
jgi:hypothetical protein